MTARLVPVQSSVVTKQPVLRAEALVVARRTRIVLAGVELTVNAGDAIWIQGPNGSGKTSLLRALAGLAPVRGGTVVCAARCAFVPEKVVVGATIRCGEWLSAMRSLRGLGELDWAQAVIASGLSERVLEAPCGTLSKGMLQRVALLESLHGDCALLLLDEPFSGLDPGGREWLADALGERLSSGTALVVTDHSGVAGSALPVTALLRLQDGRCVSTDGDRAPTVSVVARRDGGRRLERRVPERDSDALLAELLADGWHIQEVRR